MINPGNSVARRPRRDAEPDCPFCWHCRPATDTDRPLPAPDGDSGYIQARRQGIYLAACVIDEVAALGLGSPQGVIDEIRRRICDLVRRELGAASRHSDPG